MAFVGSTSSDGTITQQFLKSKSGEFDVESIHCISLAHAGISDLGCIGECTCLEYLDLSYNNISHVHRLGAVVSLTRLNLSSNKITRLDGLQFLETLQSLNVCGNLLGSTDVLLSISSLTKLTTLKLHDQGTGLTNPICNTSYVDQVLLMLPALETLDGQRVRGKGSELYRLYRAIDRTIEKPPPVKLSSRSQRSQVVNEVRGQCMSKRGLQDKVVQVEEQLRETLTSCAALSQQACQALIGVQQLLNSVTTTDQQPCQ